MSSVIHALLLAAAGVGLVDPTPAHLASKVVLGGGLLLTLLGVPRARAWLTFAALGASLEPLLGLTPPLLTLPLALAGLELSRRNTIPALESLGSGEIIAGIVLAALALLAGPFVPLAVVSAALAALAFALLFRRSLLLCAASAFTLLLIGQIVWDQYRNPGDLFFSYERSEPSLLDFFSRTLRRNEIADYRGVEFLKAGVDHYFLSDSKGWLSDGGMRVLTSAAPMAVFASEWLKGTEPQSHLTLLTFSTPELCETLGRAAPEVEIFQAAPFLNPRGCAQIPGEGSTAIASARHLMTFPAHTEYLSRHALPDFESRGHSLWHCDSDELLENVSRSYATLEQGFEGRPGPYFVRIGTGYCLITAGPGFFSNKHVLDNPVVHRTLAFSADRSREVTPP